MHLARSSTESFSQPIVLLPQVANDLVDVAAKRKATCFCLSIISRNRIYYTIDTDFRESDASTLH